MTEQERYYKRMNKRLEHIDGETHFVLISKEENEIIWFFFRAFFLFILILVPGIIVGKSFEESKPNQERSYIVEEVHEAPELEKDIGLEMPKFEKRNAHENLSKSVHVKMLEKGYVYRGKAVGYIPVN